MFAMNGTAVPKIDFFCIGAARSGSTWLYSCVNEHPGITISKSKEPNFFVKKVNVFDGEENPRFLRDWEWYASLFSHRQNGHILGDFSIHLIHNTADAPYLIQKHFPEAKFIVMLRDPVARTYSQYWFEKRHKRIVGVPATFEEALKNHELLFRSHYYDQLKIWLDVFPRERFHFILDIDLKQDPAHVLESVYTFLGVEPDYQPPSLFRQINVASDRQRLYDALGKIMRWARDHRLGYVVDTLERVGMKRLARYFLVKTVGYPPLNPGTRQRLREYYLPDIEKLEELIGRSLDQWKSVTAHE